MTFGINLDDVANRTVEDEARRNVDALLRDGVVLVCNEQAANALRDIMDGRGFTVAVEPLGFTYRVALAD